LGIFLFVVIFLVYVGNANFITLYFSNKDSGPVDSIVRRVD